jgi:hypothetical protein
MLPGLSIALMAGAQAVAAASSGSAPVYGPDPNPVSAPAAAPVKESQRDCAKSAVPDPNSREIVVCAVRPNGYRLDPDVLAARRLKKNGESGRPRNPHETFADHSCARVGPMGCRGQATIDVFTAAAAVATMAQRLSNGQEIGSTFQTTPTSSEYQLYLEAKRQREEAEAAKAAKAKAAAAQAAADATKAPH